VLRPLEVQPPWLVRLVQVLTGVLVTADLVLIGVPLSSPGAS
jgi:hypothetical protein